MPKSPAPNDPLGPACWLLLPLTTHLYSLYQPSILVYPFVMPSRAFRLCPSMHTLVARSLVVPARALYLFLFLSTCILHFGISFFCKLEG